MGWSCDTRAGDVFRGWANACYAQTGSQNVYENGRGQRFMYERGREQADGAITGAVHRFVTDTTVVRAGSFRIDADGRVARWPTGLRQLIERSVTAH